MEEEERDLIHLTIIRRRVKEIRREKSLLKERVVIRSKQESPSSMMRIRSITSTFMELEQSQKELRLLLIQKYHLLFPKNRGKRTLIRRSLITR